jgi:hypothetical protein
LTVQFTSSANLWNEFSIWFAQFEHNWTSIADGTTTNPFLHKLICSFKDNHLELHAF